MVEWSPWKTKQTFKAIIKEKISGTEKNEVTGQL